jgi:phosphopantothenoylcysteine decarboxylase/phosphopantothenate--cysteine ligase
MHFLITAGGTREYIDPVRFISNASSGKTGYALAQAAAQAGHKVTVISASDLQPPVGVYFVGVESAEDMFNAVKKFFHRCDCLVMAAAVADYTVVRPSKTKIKRKNKALTIKLKPTADILRWATRHKKRDQIVIGFALEDRAICSRAEKKLKEKQLDMIIANAPVAIGADEAAVQIKIAGRKWISIPQTGKAVVARKIISYIESMAW